MQAGSEVPPGSIGVPAIRPERRWEIDWLWILAVLLLVPYHTARIFDTGTEFYLPLRNEAGEEESRARCLKHLWRRQA